MAANKFADLWLLGKSTHTHKCSHLACYLLYYLSINIPLGLMHVRGAISLTGCLSTNCTHFSSHTLMKMSFCCAELPHHGTEEDMSKIACLYFSFSPTLSLLCILPKHPWQASSTPKAIHEWTAEEKREFFNPILPAQWHCSGKLLGFFAWVRSKSLALFCLWCLGLKLPSFHGLLIAWKHQS